MRLVFLSDRYPPDVVGGAELSLFHLVNELKRLPGIEIHVVALSEKLEQVTREVVDGVAVTRVPSRYDHRFPLPNSAVVVPWARERKPAMNTLRGQIERRLIPWLDRKFDLPLKRTIPALKAHVKYLIKRTRAPRLMKLALLLANSVSYIRSRENIECLDEDFDRIVRIDALREVIREIEPDVVHADNQRSIMRYAELDLPYPALALVRDLKFVCPRRVIIGHVGERPCPACDMACLKTIPGLIRPLLRRIFERNREYRLRRLTQYRRIATTSRFLADLLDHQAGIKAAVVPNPLGDVAAMTAAKQRLQRRSEAPTLLSVGMLQPHKGIDYAIRIMPELRRRIPGARLQIVGMGGYEPALRKEIEKLDAAAYIHFSGFQSGDDLFQSYVDADLAVCFTRWPEPFGRVPLEAMFFERPVLASRQGGFLETVLHGRTGLLVEPGDEAGLLQAAAELLADPERRRAMGRAGHAHVLSHFAPAVIAGRMARLYQEVAADAAAAGGAGC